VNLNINHNKAQLFATNVKKKDMSRINVQTQISMHKNQKEVRLVMIKNNKIQRNMKVIIQVLKVKKIIMTKIKMKMRKENKKMMMMNRSSIFQKEDTYNMNNMKMNIDNILKTRFNLISKMRKHIFKDLKIKIQVA
jgi:hypothetical protein